jgi:hypothetical protein
MPRDQTLPDRLDFLGSFPNVIRCIEEEEDSGRVWAAAQGINGVEATYAKTVSPMLDLPVMATWTARRRLLI